MNCLRATVLGALTVAVLPSCFPLPNSKEEPTKAELAKTAPTLAGLTVDEAQACFPGFTFTTSGDERSDLHTGTQKIGESSATVTIVSYAPDAVANIAVSVHRPGHATGPMLDRLMTEYLPKLIDLPCDGSDPQAARAWLTECRLRMSLSGYNNETSLGSSDYTLNVLRNRATLRVAANGRPALVSRPATAPTGSPTPSIEGTPTVQRVETPVVASPQATSVPSAVVPTEPVTYIANRTIVPEDQEGQEEEANDDETALRAARELAEALQRRLDSLLAKQEPLATLEDIADFREDLDTIATEGPDTPAGKRAHAESAAIGMLWLSIYHRNRVDFEKQLADIIDTSPESRAAREATALLADVSGDP